MIRTINKEGIHITRVTPEGRVNYTAPFPFPIHEAAQDFEYDPETREITYTLEDIEQPYKVTLTEQELADAEEWVPEPSEPTVPDQLTPRQFHLIAFSQFGLTEADLLAAIDSIADETQKTLALIDYKKSQGFRWDWPLLVQMADQLGITEEQRKLAWIEGAKL